MTFTLEVLLKWLAWCSVINIGILTAWFLVFALMRDWVFRIHSRWFTITQADFDIIHYATMARFKVIVLVVNVVPYLALRIVT
jgi:hypothetical protein